MAQTPTATGPMARQKTKTTQIVDTFVDAQPTNTVVGGVGFSDTTGEPSKRGGGILDP